MCVLASHFILLLYFINPLHSAKLTKFTLRFYSCSPHTIHSFIPQSFPIGLLRAWSACVAELVCALLAASLVMSFLGFSRGGCSNKVLTACLTLTHTFFFFVFVWFLFQPQNMWHAFSQDISSADCLAAGNSTNLLVFLL